MQYEVFRSTFGEEANETKFAAFINFSQSVVAQNADPDRTWVAGLTQFASLTKAEFTELVFRNNSAIIALYAGKFNGTIVAQTGRRLLATAPVNFSWVGKNKLSPVKDQGQCGSCFAFSTASALEAQLAIQSGMSPLVLSVEQLKSCPTFPAVKVQLFLLY